MSYYGVRKVKTIKDSEGKYNMGCEYYDSSITDYKGNRVWHVCDTGFYKEGFNTKEELEYAIFKDTLDGNFHGTNGKYSCIGWTNCKVELSEEEYNTIKELEAKKWDSSLSKEDKDKARIKYNEYRYSTWYKAWKNYLKAEKEQKKSNKNTYIVIVDYKGYHGIYIRKHGKTTTGFTYWESEAKLFNKSIEELKKEFCNDGFRSNQYSHVYAVDVTNNITGKGKARILNITLQEIENNKVILK